MNIPKGKTVCYDSLTVGSITVKGHLKVKGILTAKHIQGSGYIEAGEVVCDTLQADTLRAEIATAKKIAVKKLFVRDCRASSAIIATDFAESLVMRTARLTVSLFSINELITDDLIVLPQKKRGMLGTLFAGWIRSLFSRPPKPAGKKPKRKKAAPANGKADAKAKALAGSRQAAFEAANVEQLIAELERRGYIRKEDAEPKDGYKSADRSVIDIECDREDAA